MIFRNSLSFLVNLYVIAFHVSFHFLFIDIRYICNIIGFCHLDIYVPTTEYYKIMLVCKQRYGIYKQVKCVIV